jgi:UDP-N-acetylglucosamine acyltransferase
MTSPGQDAEGLAADRSTGEPQRYPFLLVDRLVEVEAGRRAVAVKNVSANEPFFSGHFPGHPVMPGVLICEAMAQVGGYLVKPAASDVLDGAAVEVVGLHRARFRRAVVPGDQLDIEVTALARRAAVWKMRGIARVDGRVVADAEFTVLESPGGRSLPAPRRVHETAVVAPGAELGEGVSIGPYATIGPQVRIGPGCVIGPHAVVEGHTTLGARNRVFQFASVGAPPQDLKYNGEPSRLEIGDDNIVREFTSISPGTTGGGMVTRIGNRNLLMVNSHVAHDCKVGDHAIVANGASLGGHVVVEDFVIVGGLAGVHQFVRLGQSAILGAGTMASMDVPPFCNATGDRARLHGLNVVGLRRRGFTDLQLRALKRAYHILFQSHLKAKEAIARAREELGDVPEVEYLLAFIESSRRGVCR